MRTKIIAIAGKSSSGKSTLCNGLCARYKELNKIIPNTTRPQRSYEADGQDYYFIPETEFKDYIYLEKTSFNGWKYGTPLIGIEKNCLNIGVFNPKSLKQLEKRASRFDYDLDIFFLDRDDRKRLLSSLSRDDKADVNEVIRRFKADNRDFKNFKKKFVSSYIFTQEDLSFISDFIASFYSLKEW